MFRFVILISSVFLVMAVSSIYQPKLNAISEFPNIKRSKSLKKNKKPFKQENIIIKEGTRIGTHCVIAPGVTIGKNCFIKMNCFIKKDVPDNTTIMAGTIWQDDYEF